MAFDQALCRRCGGGGGARSESSAAGEYGTAAGAVGSVGDERRGDESIDEEIDRVGMEHDSLLDDMDETACSFVVLSVEV